MSFALGRKCYIRNWTVAKFCDISTGDFRFHFRFSTEDEISFSSAFSLTAENGKCIFSRPLEITLPYVNDFQTLNNPGSGQPVGASKN